MRQRLPALPTPTPSRRQADPFFPQGPGHATGTIAPVREVVAQPFLQRQTAPQPAPQAQSIPDADRGLWVGRVDAAVRTKFGLTGPGLNLTRVSFLDEPGFAAAFPAASIAEKLLELFLSPPSGVIHSILRHHRMGLAGIERLRRFIQAQMTAGFFEEAFFDPRSGQMITRRITPRELVAMHIGGITDVGPAARGARRVVMQTPADVETLVHEACHFYVHNNFKALAASVPNRGNLRIGMGIEHTLMEGFAEHFARQVMRDNAAVFGPLTVNAYQTQVEQVWRYAITIGQADAVAAYFHGDAGAIARLRSALSKYETTHPDLIEPWP